MNVARIPIPNLQLLQKGPKMEHFSPKIVEAVETVKTSPSVQRAFDYVKDHLEETIRDQKELVLIEAPTGHEKAKAFPRSYSKKTPVCISVCNHGCSLL